MKLLILSDLHLEWAGFDPPGTDLFDVAVLAGDISHAGKAVEWARRESTFGGKPVVLVPGNHEFYGSVREAALGEMRKQAEGSNVHLLDRDELLLTDKAGRQVRFLGTTLWTDFLLDGPNTEHAMAIARLGLNDFAGAIRRFEGRGKRRFTPEDSAREHALSREWLEQRLADAPDNDAATVIVTHHGPSDRSIVPKYQGHELNPCFTSSLPEAFFAQDALWIHGHIHNSVDYRQGKTRVLTNPRGYRLKDSSFENPAFRRDLVVEIGG